MKPEKQECVASSNLCAKYADKPSKYRGLDSISKSRINSLKTPKEPLGVKRPQVQVLSLRWKKPGFYQAFLLPIK